jgi:hypothetical protein
MASAWVVVPWILVIVGWWIADKTANERECRKEMRSLLDVLIKVASETEDRARAYHVEARRPGLEKEAEIKAGFARLSSILATANDRKLCEARYFGGAPPSASLLRSRVFQFRQAATLNNFESSSFVQQAASSDLLSEISAKRDDLVNDVERAFTLRYY